eukprot:NODE_9617_length_1411_cov_1.589564.p1 GENE.NODE_9617_length_1411_cov_1.589564~~NODE_9617_length_1411_cov_1.589564.p1  ORF type:complete len:294 (+),score=71.28 NODE_9617_length_1411_cov_1.589564:493-1374(+)
MGDNGGETSQAGSNCYSLRDHDCLRSGKGTVWEGGIRNNAVLCSSSERYVPSRLHGTKFSKGLVTLTDIHATIRSLAGASDNVGYPIDGEDIWGRVMNGHALPRNDSLVNIDTCVQLYAGSIGCDGWSAAYMYIGCFQYGGCGTWKVMYGETGDGWYSIVPTLMMGSDGVLVNMTSTEEVEMISNLTRLYNVAADPSEQNDLVDVYPDIVSFMLGRIEEYSQDIVPACNIMGGSCHGTEAHPIHDETGAWIPWMDEPNLQVVPPEVHMMPPEVHVSGVAPSDLTETEAEQCAA